VITWGVSFGSHDAALAVFEGSRLLFASHSERFSKIKDDPNLCQQLVDHALAKYGTPTEIFYYENPWKKKLRYLKSGQWANLFETSPKETLSNLGVDTEFISIRYVDHHKSHAAAGYYTSGLPNASVVVIDAIGEMATASVWKAKGVQLYKRYQQDYPHSIGLLYSALTQAAGYQPNREEYIFMGLAAYGNADALGNMLEERLVSFGKDTPLVELKHNLHRGLKGLIPNDLDPKDLAAAGQGLYERCLKHVLDYTWQNLPSEIGRAPYTTLFRSIED